MSHRKVSGFTFGVVGQIAVRAALAAVLVIAFSPAGALAQEHVTKFFVHVPVVSEEQIAQLAAAGFDVAGSDPRDLTVGIVGTEKDLERLRDLGYRYSVVSQNDGPGIQALSDYTDPAELSAFMDQVAAAYPNLARKIALTGPLFEGHVQYAMQITKDVTLPNERPAFLLDAQHHAREVMTPEIARDMIDWLTSRYATDPQVQRWVDSVNIYVVPSVNPDGAAVVFTSDNMWRRNRHPNCQVDVNRNYPFAWGSCNGSSNICTDDTNRGTEPGSEPETQGMLSLIAEIRPFFALSYHTYGEYLMYSYGCNDPNETAAFDSVGNALNAILVNDSGTTPFAVPSRYGPIWDAIYLVDGGSIDTSYAVYGAYGFTIEANTSSFQPDYATWRNVTVQRQRTAWQFFLDRTLDGPQMRGKITNAVTGAAVPGRLSVQEVTFTHGESQRRAAANGHYYWLAQPNQTYHVTYSMPGYCTVTRTIAVGTGPATQDVALVPPTPPSNVSATGAGDNRIDVSWSPAIDAVEYHVQRSLVSGGPYTEVGVVAAPQTTFSDTTVSGGATYYYVVRAMQPCDSGNSAQASASTTGVCFVGPAFSGLASATNSLATTCSVTLGWPAATSNCGGTVTYRVHRSTTTPFAPDASNLVASGLQTTSYTDHAALTDGSNYYYLVRAVESSNGADDGNSVALSAVPTGPTGTGTWSDDAGDTGTAKLVLASPWTVLSSGGKNGPKVYATGTYPNNVCSALTTPAISVTASSVLSFNTKYDIETNWDAAIVEVATGPTFSTWSRLTTVNYPDSLSNTGNACGFPKSFTGTVFSKYYTPPVYSASPYSGSLAAFAGQDIKLRFRISADSTGNGLGWWVDDVAVTNAVFKQVCTPGTAANPKEVGPASSPLHASRGTSGTAVSLTYGPGCGTLDNVVYWGTGPISGAPVWSGAACAVGNTGQTSFDPGDPGPGGLLYFVIVGQNATKEGSYGTSYAAFLETERTEAAGVGACDMPQDLTGTCP